MDKVDYNQFQSIYELEGKTKILVDFLCSNIKLYSVDTMFNYKYDDKYNEQSIKLDSILIKKSSEILAITLITDLNCNMDCLYCYEKDVSLNTKNEYRIINVYEVINLISSEIKSKKYKEIEVNVIGGEPLLENNIEFLNNFFKEIKLLNINTNFSLVTNGINVSNYIDNIIFWGINDIQITLDGTEKIHNQRRMPIDKNLNGFKKIEEGVNMLLQHNIKVFLRINVDKNNVNYIVDLGRYIKKNMWLNKGLKAYIYPLTSSGNKDYVLKETELTIFKMILDKFKDEEDVSSIFKFDFHGINYIDELIENKCPTIRTRFCGVSKGQYVIYVDGTILNCWWGIENDIFKIGKIDQMNYYIDDSKIKKFSKRNTLEIQGCKVCKFKYICGSGCVYNEYLNKGTINTGNCSQFDLLIKEYLNYVLRKIGTDKRM